MRLFTALSIVLVFTLLFPAVGLGQGPGDGNMVQDQDRDRLQECENFVDEDGDGICDLCGGDHSQDRTRDQTQDQQQIQDCENFVDEDGDGICDLCGGDHSQNQSENQNRRRFRRGDADNNGVHDLSDAITVLGALFQNRALTCEDAADANDDGEVDISDSIRLLWTLYCGTGPGIPAPFRNAGDDPTPDALGCQ